MNVYFARPDIDNLVFHLFDRAIHPEFFTVYANNIVDKEAFSASISLCDAGHVIEFRRGDQIITEVTATDEQELPESRHCFERRLRGCRDEAFEFESGISYQASYQLEKLPSDVFHLFNEELLVDCNRAVVSHRFPGSNRMSPQPLSLIRVDAGGRSLLVHAYHTFPESFAVVKTQSLFEF